MYERTRSSESRSRRGRTRRGRCRRCPPRDGQGDRPPPRCRPRRRRACRPTRRVAVSHAARAACGGRRRCEVRATRATPAAGRCCARVGRGPAAPGSSLALSLAVWPGTWTIGHVRADTTRGRVAAGRPRACLGLPRLRQRRYRTLAPRTPSTTAGRLARDDAGAAGGGNGEVRQEWQRAPGKPRGAGWGLWPQPAPLADAPSAGRARPAPAGRAAPSTPPAV